MKGKIFIAWSGQDTLAKEVKVHLEENDFIGIVGGEDQKSTGLFVGYTVLNEINHCNQAIFIVQKKADGKISNNLMFEFGYALAKFKPNKIHVFFVDIEQNDQIIPSDLHGIWAEFFKDAPQTSVAETIVEKFLSNQKHIVPESKMSIVNNYHALKDLIAYYPKSPKCSEYELAQYILFFSVACYMYSTEKDALDLLMKFENEYKNPSKELDFSTRLGIRCIETLSNIQKEGDLLFLKKEDFRSIYRKTSNMLEELSTWEADDFALWAKVLIYNIVNYALILYSSNPETNEQRAQGYLKESIKRAEDCLAICEELLKNHTNLHFAELFKAYMYRNLAIANKMLGEDAEKIGAHLRSSYKMREALWDYYNETQKINTTILESFEMEYFLALSEQLEYISDEFSRMDCMEDCQRYIEKVENANLEKTHFIRKIELNIQESNN